MNEASPRQAQRAERILAAASDLFAHYGYDKTTMEDIAHAAHVSKGALYLHYRSKEDLFDALILRETDVLQDQIMARLADEGDQLTVFSLYRHSIEVSLARPLIRALMTNNRRVLGDFMQRIKQAPHYEDTMSFRNGFVEQLQQAGMIRADIDPEALSAVMAAVRYGYLMLPDLIEDAPAPEVTGALIADMFQRSFGTDYGNSEAGRAVMHEYFARAREFMAALRANRAASPARTISKED